MRKVKAEEVLEAVVTHVLTYLNVILWAYNIVEFARLF